MRVYISVDMEGIAGVVHESQTDPTTPAFAAEYGRFRRLMTAEANAAVEGALAAGATRVLVNDSHWFMRNLLAEELHQAAELVSGDPKPRSMVQGIDAGFDAALFIGYHARAGTRNAILDHTYADRIHDVRLNGKSVGELGLNAGVAGVHGVPIALVSGACALHPAGAGHARGGFHDDHPRRHGGALPGRDAHRGSHGRVYPSGVRGSIPGVADAAESFSRDLAPAAPARTHPRSGTRGTGTPAARPRWPGRRTTRRARPPACAPRGASRRPRSARSRGPETRVASTRRRSARYRGAWR